MKSFIKFAISFLFIFMVLMTWIKQGEMKKRAEQSVAEQQIEYDKKQNENERLKNIIQTSEGDDFIISSARTRLGLIRPGEIPVYPKK